MLTFSDILQFRLTLRILSCRTYIDKAKRITEEFVERSAKLAGHYSMTSVLICPIQSSGNLPVLIVQLRTLT